VCVQQTNKEGLRVPPFYLWVVRQVGQEEHQQQEHQQQEQPPRIKGTTTRIR
jgi:hypothetical protein